MTKAVVEGKARRVSCIAHILDPKGDRTEEWFIGKDIEADDYNSFKDERGDIYNHDHL
jgi:hypothetical protein